MSEKISLDSSETDYKFIILLITISRAYFLSLIKIGIL